MMDEQRQPWERCKGESRQAFAAFCLYLGLGSQRTIEAAWAKHLEQTQRGDEEATEGPLRKSTGRWRTWATKWQWRNRADAHDDYQHALAEDQRLDAELRRRAEESEENAREQKSTVGQLRAARRVLSGALQLAAPGITALLQAAQRGDFESHPPLKTMLAAMPRLASALAMVVDAEREALGEMGMLDAAPPVEGAAAKLDTLIQSLRDLVPPERWADLATKLEEIDSSSNGRK